MKSLMLVLSAVVFVTGCSQPKNRLADDKNIEYQAKQAAKKGKPDTQTFSVDVPTPQGNVQIPITAAIPVPDKSSATNNTLNSNEAEELAHIERSEKEDTSSAAATGNTESSTETENSEKKNEKVDTSASRENAVSQIADAVGAKEEQKQEQKPSSENQETAGEDQKDVYKVSLAEAKSILNQVFKITKNSEAALLSLSPINKESSGISFKELGFDILADNENARISLIVKNQSIATFDNIKQKFGNPIVLESNGIQLLVVCANENCDLIMFTFRKEKDDEIVLNLPLFIKIKDKKIIEASLKTNEEYEQEAKSENNAQGQPEQQAQNTKPLPINLDERSAIFEQLGRTGIVQSDDELKVITSLIIAPESKIDMKKLGIGASVNKDGLIFSVVYDNKILTGASNINLKFGEATKSATREGFNFLALCADTKCSVIFAVFTKIEKDNILLNFPLFFRVIDGKPVLTGLKSDADYAEETRQRLKADNKK